MWRRRQEDTHARRGGRDRYLGDRILVDRVHVYRRLITELDLELSVCRGRKGIGGAKPGIEARNHLRLVRRYQRLVVGLGQPRRRRRGGRKIEAALCRADHPGPRHFAEEFEIADAVLTPRAKT